MDEQLARPAAVVHVDEHVLHDLVVVPRVVRGRPDRPTCASPVSASRANDRARPLVVAGAQIRVPDAGIAGAVEEQVGLGVVGDPAPHRRSAELPLFRRPRRDAEVLALVLGVEGVEVGADLHVAVRAGVERAPHLLAGLHVERRDVAAHAELAAGVADEHVVLDDDRRGGERLAAVDVADLGPPRFLAGLGIDGDHGARRAGCR